MQKLQIEIVTDGTGAVKEIKRVGNAIDGMDKSTQKADKSSAGLWKQFLIGGVALGAARTAFDSIKNVLIDSVKAYTEQEMQVKQLETVLKSTGGAVGMTKDELIKLSSSLQSMTTYGDEAILGAENLLLTFTKIGKDIFPDALGIVLDMSTALGQDLKSSAIQVGKALQDPILGVTALRRVGVNFSDDQAKLIKRLVETGHTLDAQKYILQELQTEFGGSAKASAETFGGSLQQLQNLMGDFQEEIGKAIAENADFKDGLSNLKKLITDKSFQDGIISLVNGLVKVITFAAKAAAGIGYLVKTVVSSPWDEMRKKLDSSSTFITMRFEIDKTSKSIEDTRRIMEKYGVTSRMAQNQLLAYIRHLNSEETAQAKSTAEKKKAQVTLQQINNLFGGAAKTVKAYGETNKKAQEEAAKAAKKAAEEIKKKTEEIIKEYHELTKDIYNWKIEVSDMGDIAEKIDNEFLKLAQDQAKAADAAIWEELASALRLCGMSVSDVRLLIKRLSGELKDGQVVTKKFEFAAMSLKEKIDLINQTFGDFLGLLADLGLSADSVINDLVGIGQGISALAEGIAAKNPFAIISGGIKIISSAFKALKKLFGGDGVGEAIKRELYKIGGVSKELEKRLRELEKQCGDTRLAIAIMFDEILQEADITAENFGQFAIELREILSMLDEGKMTSSETAKEIGDAFSVLIEKAKELGTEGSLELRQLFDDLKSRGLEVAEVTEYIMSNLLSGVSALKEFMAAPEDMVSKDQLKEMKQELKTLQEGTKEYKKLSAEIERQKQLRKEYNAELKIAEKYSQAFYDALVKEGKSFYEIAQIMGEALPAAYRKYYEENKKTLSKINALKEMMTALGNTGYMTAETFAQMEKDAWRYYKQLLKNGKDEKMALEAVMPLLLEQARLASLYGFELDNNTKKLLKQAGIDWTKIKDPQKEQLEVQQSMLLVMTAMAEVFGVVLPDAVKKYIKSLEDAKKKADDISTAVNNIPKHIDFTMIFGDGKKKSNKIPVSNYIVNNNYRGDENRSTTQTENVTSGKIGNDQASTVIYMTNHINVTDPQKRTVAATVADCIRDNIAGLGKLKGKHSNG